MIVLTKIILDAETDKIAKIKKDCSDHVSNYMKKKRSENLKFIGHFRGQEKESEI